MAQDHTDHLDAEEAQAKAAECRELGQRERRTERRVMFEHMAETWERVARSLENGQ